MRPRSSAAPRWAAALLAVLAVGCDTTDTPRTPVSSARYTATGGATLDLRGHALAVAAPPGGALVVRADAPAADLLFRPPALRTGGVLVAALESEVVLEAEREVAPRVVWRSERLADGAHALSVETTGGRLTRVEGVRTGGGIVSLPASALPCGRACEAGQTQEAPGSVHYTRVCDQYGCTVITTYDFVGGGDGAAGALWTPPGAAEAVDVTEVRFVVEGGPELGELRRLTLGGFEELLLVADRFAD